MRHRWLHDVEDHVDAVRYLHADLHLHDVIEDTSIDREIIESEFGPLIAEYVTILTNEPGSDRAERKTKTCVRLAKVSGPAELALIVKNS